MRIYTLLDILSTTRQPLDDQALIAAIKERLGLTHLSARTLHRDCDFLLSCGYPVDHRPLPADRRYAWQLSKDMPPGRRSMPEPLTLLELVAFSMARDLLRAFEGTVLWTGIEALRHKIEREASAAMLSQVEEARRAFQVEWEGAGRYADRPRLMSALSIGIMECREIEIEHRPGEAGDAIRCRLQPHRLVVRPPTVHLLGFAAESAADSRPLLIDIARIERVRLLDGSFVPRPIAET